MVRRSAPVQAYGDKERMSRGKMVRALGVSKTILVVLIVVVILIACAAAIVSFKPNPYLEYATYSYGTFGYYLSSPARPAPTGLGAFGLERTHGVLLPYVVETSEIAGGAQISSLSAYNASLPSNFQYGANLQLNCMLMVNTSTGTQVYWLQDTSRFNTQTLQVISPRDTIYNVTTMSSGIKAVGNGEVSLSEGQYSYNYGNSSQRYYLPLNMTLAISASTVLQGVQVNFYNSPFGGGTFDTILLSIPDAESAAIVVTPYDLILGLSADAELVWTGYCCGYATTFTHMNSSLSLWYFNSRNQAVYFPAYYSFGGETGEKATNLVVSSISTGGRVSIGSQHNGQLSLPDD